MIELTAAVCLDCHMIDARTLFKTKSTVQGFHF
jgi:hypothetical protein